MIQMLFVKQKTAYEMRISDWSSDVCSSDLADVDHARYRVLRQQRIGVAREFEGAEQVELEDPAPLVLGVLGAGSGEVAAGIVAQDVEALVLVFDPVEQLAALFVVADQGNQGAQVAVGAVFGQFDAGRTDEGVVGEGGVRA